MCSFAVFDVENFNIMRGIHTPQEAADLQKVFQQHVPPQYSPALQTSGEEDVAASCIQNMQSSMLFFKKNFPEWNPSDPAAAQHLDELLARDDDAQQVRGWQRASMLQVPGGMASSMMMMMMQRNGMSAMAVPPLAPPIMMPHAWNRLHQQQEHQRDQQNSQRYAHWQPRTSMNSSSHPDSPFTPPVSRAGSAFPEEGIISGTDDGAFQRPPPVPRFAQGAFAIPPTFPAAAGTNTTEQGAE